MVRTTKVISMLQLVAVYRRRLTAALEQSYFSTSSDPQRLQSHKNLLNNTHTPSLKLKRNYGTFVPTYFHSHEPKCHRWDIRSLYFHSHEPKYHRWDIRSLYFHSHEPKYHRWDIRSLVLSLFGTFAARSQSSVKLSPSTKRNVHVVISLVSCWQFVVICCLRDTTCTNAEVETPSQSLTLTSGSSTTIGSLMTLGSPALLGSPTILGSPTR